ncbi:GNAT family N-acetyltransferase [Reinekea marinisedimentorum]|uniref:Ribosomal protein S18 acetylase RimI-like enzyme n=1 Tax=Reinekea marinisedimentorum TaxID=230495 RepID=A0A4R3HWY0_9GAMM|nr:GNAT family N-acetyltransferase [Reinekea marinisedimentorum]TCS36771.1 ribosomal protein S18 acetylase RimI-like enzyme [Reinekea marinisedimentorum]
MEILVRKAQAKDAFRLAELNFLFNEVKVSVKSLIESLETNKSEHVFVALIDEELVGFATIDIHYSFCYEFPNAEITELYIIESGRGKGAATKLVNEVINFSKSLGADEIHLRANSSNLAANKFYNHIGLKLGNTNTYYSV